MIHHISVPGGLASRTIADLRILFFDVTGVTPQGPLYYAPTMFLLQPEVAHVMPLPEPRPGLAMVHDYQSVEMTGPMPLDSPLTLHASREERGTTHEYTITIPGSATARTALRLIPEAELSTAAPLAMRPVKTGPTLRFSADQVGRYLRLSRDTNTLHSDIARAQSFGLAAPVVPGMLLASTVQTAVEVAHPNSRLKSMRSRFAAPVLIDQPLNVALQERGAGKLRAFVVVEKGAAAIVDLEITQG